MIVFDGALTPRTIDNSVSRDVLEVMVADCVQPVIAGVSDAVVSIAININDPLLLDGSVGVVDVPELIAGFSTLTGLPPA